jgi:putative radical SAM enzyme (TIGR03279 family)
MARKRGGLVRRVERGSLAEHLGVEPGDSVLAANGRKLRDEIDFRYFMSDTDVTLLIRKRDGRQEAYRIDKDADEPFGVAFQDPLFDQMKTCKNNCVFCFIRQIPKEMRKSLHVRDDDYRMSFLYGNFVSLTNLDESDWERIEKQRISPLRVSVHTTDPKLRQVLMSNPEAAKIMEHLRRLTRLGIRLHAQCVLLKGLNDGDNLLTTLSDLDWLGENMVSVGVVPAVYTRYRAVTPSPRMDPGWAGEVLEMVQAYADGAIKRRGSHWVYGADEFYIVSGKPFPPYEYYDDFYQYENGIGIVTDFRRSLEEEVGKNPCPNSCPEELTEGPGSGVQITQVGPVNRRRRIRKALAVTGEMAAGEVVSAVRKMGLERQVSVCPVKNTFFGDSVTAAGLLTGQDIISAVLEFGRRADLREYVVVAVPDVALFNGVFLDNCRLADIERATGLPAVAVKPAPASLREIATWGEERIPDVG